MDIIPWLFDTYPTLFWPGIFPGWLGWFIFLGIIIGLLWWQRQAQLPWNMRRLGIFAGLVLLAIFTNLFIGIQMPAGAALPLPDIPQEPRGPAIMLLSALPILLAGGILGPIAAAALGFLSGGLRFLWDTHSIFTSLELALLGILFSLAVRQRYRTRIFVLLREPLLTAILMIVIYAPFFIIDSALISPGSMAAGLDYGLAALGSRSLALGCEFLLGGLFMQILAIAFPADWGRNLPLQPSPMERSLEARFLFGAGSLILFFFLALLAGDWLVAGSAARDMLNNRIKGTAEVSSQNVPFFLETGQNLASQASKRPEMLSASGDVLSKVLADQVQSVPYFDQMLVFDRSKSLIGSYSSISGAQVELEPEEQTGLDLANSGVLSQVYAIRPAVPDQAVAARVSFIIALADRGTSGNSTGQTTRILIARTDLANNPFSLPLITSLKSMSELEGSGMLLDENGRILYAPVSSQVMSQYSGLQKSEPASFDDTAPDGTRNLVYYQPVTGQPWAIVLTVPAQQVQQQALMIAAPSAGMILLLTGIALAILLVGLKGITNSLRTLAIETVRIAQGQLDHALTVDGVDEVGQLRRSFEQMRLSLQARLAELNRLLLVSQGVASSLDVNEAVQPVLEAVLSTGAGAVRIVMPPLDEIIPVLPQVHRDDVDWGEAVGQSTATVLALGANKTAYARFDEQVVGLANQQKNLFVVDAARALGLMESTHDLLSKSFSKTAPVTPALASLFAISLRYENQKFGVLWAGYETPHTFSDSDVRFLTTLAGQAALAASNHHLFRTAEVGRQRLAAILASTPDPVLVIDQYDRLLLANPAASQVLGSAVESGTGQPIEMIIKQTDLLAILRAAPSDRLSGEISLPNGRVYLTTASPVVADDQAVGRVCILRDVTHFKELDKVKTEFVNTVSHDLRSPLTTMRGYATMLDMIGALNEQQQGYVRKILTSVDNMTRLVNSLLDLGRVEAGVGLQLEVVPLADSLEKAIGTLRLAAQQKNIELAVSMPPEAQTLIEVDPSLFQQAVYNLVENAIKYTPQGGRVSVALQVTTREFLIAVQDNGIGIDPLDQPRLFEKFYRSGQREAREQKGSGLGLAIVKSIIEHHGGKVWLESQLGKGSTFFAQIPMKQDRPAKLA